MKTKEVVYFELTICGGLQKKGSKNTYCSIESMSYDTAIPQKEIDLITRAAKSALRESVRKSGRDITLKLDVPFIV